MDQSNLKETSSVVTLVEAISPFLAQQYCKQRYDRELQEASLGHAHQTAICLDAFPSSRTRCLFACGLCALDFFPSIQWTKATSKRRHPPS